VFFERIDEKCGVFLSLNINCYQNEIRLEYGGLMLTTLKKMTSKLPPETEGYDLE
jgi:hypothetical protein